jgi:hypothetical protein
MLRSFYRGSLWGAAVGLPLALGAYLIGRWQDHAIDRGVRLLDHARDIARM